MANRHKKWFLNTDTFLIKMFFIAKFDCSRDWSPKLEPDKWPVLRPFLAIFCQVLTYISQNWDSVSHFEILYRFCIGSKVTTKKKNMKKCKKNGHRLVFLFLQNFQKTEKEIFLFVFFINFEPIKIKRPTLYLHNSFCHSHSHLGNVYLLVLSKAMG